MIEIISDTPTADPEVTANVPPDVVLEIWLAKKQHARTLRWVRERLEAGEHLDDLLAEEREERA